MCAGVCRSALYLLLALSALSTACQRRQITYTEDVAPLIAARCLGCHANEGLAALPTLDSYERVVSSALRVKLAVEGRMMPPWGADNTGLCRTWKHALWLSKSEIETFGTWITHGVPRGPERPPTRPQSAEASRKLAHVDAVLDTGASYEPTLGSGSYRCFIVDPQLARDRLLSAFRVVSSDPRMVAQITVFALESEEGEARAMELDRQEEGPGYTCYGGARVEPARWLLSWTWDAPVMSLPQGTGLRMQGGRKLVLQIHYNVVSSGLGNATRTRVELAFDDSAREAEWLRVAAADFALPPGKTYADARGDLTIGAPLTVYGAAPRMHTLGQSLELAQRSGAGRDTCIGSFDHWNFYRQRLFEYEAPLQLSAGDHVRVSCVFNTLGSHAPVRRGETIDDEECAGYLYVVPGPAKENARP